MRLRHFRTGALWRQLAELAGHALLVAPDGSVWWRCVRSTARCFEAEGGEPPLRPAGPIGDRAAIAFGRFLIALEEERRAAGAETALRSARTAEEMLRLVIAQGRAAAREEQ